jgi:hypothetical protein
MAMKTKFAVWLFDEALVTTLKAAAESEKCSISAFVTSAIRAAMVRPSDVPVQVLKRDGSGLCLCERCVKERDRDTRRRRRNGQPVREHRALLIVDEQPKPLPKGVEEQVCPICDSKFRQAPGKGRRQQFCGQGNRTCMKYAQRYGIEKGRKMYAAKH